MSDEEVAPRPPTARRRRLWAALLSGLLVLVVALGTVLLLRATTSDDEPEPPAEPPTTGTPPHERAFPDERTTGVPAGVELKPSESVRVTKDGAVLEGLEITGTVTVEADDVVIRDTVIRNTGAFAVRVSGRNLLIEDSEIDGQGRGHAAVVFGNYTLRRVHVHDVTEGPRIAGGEVVIEDSLIHRIVQKDDNHTDAVQAVGGRRIVLRGNTILADHPDGSYGNAAFQFGEEDGAIDDCLVEGNLLGGGNYTVNGGGGGTREAACTFRDNVLLDTARYGARANLGPGSVWEASNVWRETGEPVR